MNLIRFLFKDIRLSLKGSIALFSVIVLGITASLSTHLIATGLIENSSAEKSSYSVYNTVTLLNITDFQDALYQRISSRSDIKNAFCVFAPEGEDYLIVGWLGETPSEWFPLGEGRFIKDSDSETAYVSSTIAQYNPGVIQTIQVNGKEYRIVGSTTLWLFNLINGLDNNLSSFDRSSFVFLELSELLNMDITNGFVRVQFHYDDAQKARDFSALSSELFEGMNTKGNIVLPKNPIEDSLASNFTFFILIGFLCMLTYMNIIAMYWYYLSSQMRKYKILTIIGAKKKQLFFLLSVKYFVMFSVAFLSSLAICVVLKPLFEMIRIEYLFTYRTVAVVFLFEFLGTFLISLPKILRIIGRNNSSILRRGME